MNIPRIDPKRSIKYKLQLVSSPVFGAEFSVALSKEIFPLSILILIEISEPFGAVI